MDSPLMQFIYNNQEDNPSERHRKHLCCNAFCHEHEGREEWAPGAVNFGLLWRFALPLCVLEACAIPVCLATTVCKGPTPSHLASYEAYNTIRLYPFVFSSLPQVLCLSGVSVPMICQLCVALPTAPLWGCPIAHCLCCHQTCWICVASACHPDD
eukprot:2062007-Prymnesium_polylepis.1